MNCPKAVPYRHYVQPAIEEIKTRASHQGYFQLVVCRWGQPLAPNFPTAALSQTTFFTDEDIDAMFSLFDPTGRGHISHEQYENGEWRLALPLANLVTVSTRREDEHRCW